MNNNNVAFQETGGVNFLVGYGKEKREIGKKTSFGKLTFS